jgi:plastocyanin
MQSKIKITATVFYIVLIILPLSGTDDADDPGHLRGQITITADDREDLMGRRRISDRYVSRSVRPPDMVGPMKPERYTIPEKAVIYLEPEEPLRTRVASGTSTRVILDQRDLMFHPHVLAIQQGTTVVFPNNDNVFHNVFSYSKPKNFDLGRYPQGQFRTVKFDTPGIIRIYCDIHTHMNAVILVLENSYFTSPDDSGYYSIPDIQPGNYTVNFWYGRNLVESRTVEIKSGASLILNFVY